MKKIIAIFLTLIMVLSLVACGNNGNDGETESDNSSLNSSSQSETSSSDNSESTISEKTNEITAIGHDEKVGLIPPPGYSYNDGWFCWSNSDYTVAIWLEDGKVFTTEDDLNTYIGQYPNATKKTIGSYTVYVNEEPESPNGPSTRYLVDLGGVGGCTGCMILVSSTDNNISATQTEDIIDMIASIAPMS